MTSMIEAVAALVGDAKRIVVFTGAGISAESGLPTFRAPRTGIWVRHDPQSFQTSSAFRKDAALVWSWYLGCRTQVAQAAHHAIAQLARTRELKVVTQNIDDLDQRM